MRKELTHELEVAAPADAVWAAYNSPEASKHLINTVFDKIEVIEGDGGVGTVLHIYLPPGSVPLYYKEKFVTVDHEKRLLEVIQIEGGFPELGCSSYMDSFHIIEKDPHSCIIKSTATYEVTDDVDDNVSGHITIDTLAKMAEVLSKYVLEKQAAP